MGAATMPTPRKMTHKATLERLINGALDERSPSDGLKEAVQDYLTVVKHSQRDRNRDPLPEVHEK